MRISEKISHVNEITGAELRPNSIEKIDSPSFRRLRQSSFDRPIWPGAVNIPPDRVREFARGPVIFASNHQSHIDTPVIMAALPPAWRYRIAPAMAKEFQEAFSARVRTAG